MRKLLLPTLLLILGFSTSKATIHNVNVGGGPGGPAPFYSPQFITINVGDTVKWTWTSGQHNVTRTSGPANFASGNKTAPATFQFVFTIAGFYEYECTLFNHAATQFGTITVQTPVGTAPELGSLVSIYPNPFAEKLKIDLPALTWPISCEIFSAATGELVYKSSLGQNQNVLDLPGFSKGIYIVSLKGEDFSLTRKILH